MRKRNLLIFTLVVVLMTAMSAPVFAGSQGGRPDSGESECCKEDHAVHHGVPAEILERALDHRGQMDRSGQWANFEPDPQSENRKGAVCGKKCFHRPKRPGQRYLGGLQQGAVLQKKIKDNLKPPAEGLRLCKVLVAGGSYFIGNID